MKSVATTRRTPVLLTTVVPHDRFPPLSVSAKVAAVAPAA